MSFRKELVQAGTWKTETHFCSRMSIQPESMENMCRKEIHSTQVKTW